MEQGRGVDALMTLAGFLSLTSNPSIDPAAQTKVAQMPVCATGSGRT